MKHRIHTKGLTVGIVSGIVLGALSVAGSIGSSTTAFVGANPNYAQTADGVNQNIDVNDKHHNTGDMREGWERIQDRLVNQNSFYWKEAAGKSQIPKHCQKLSHARLAKCIVNYREGLIYQEQQTRKN